MDSSTRFIIIDDDKLNNKICSTLIEKLYTNAHITCFTDAREGIEHIRTEYSNPALQTLGILFLDIKMPLMDAWEFLDAYEQFEDEVKKKIRIYILSSSIDKRDMERAQANKHVVYYLIKPLTRESISLITHALKKKEGLI